MPVIQTGTLINTFDTEWVGVLQEQAPRFIAGYIDETIRRRILLAFLRKNGRLKLGGGGPMCVWSIKFNKQQIQSIGDAGEYTFQRPQNRRQAALDWRGYYMTDLMTEKERLMNKGPGQIFDRYGRVVPELTEDITDGFGGELFNDGHAGDPNRLCGIESFATAGACTVNDLVAVPNDNYAGNNTNVGASGGGGAWSTFLAAADRPNATIATDWPAGKGSVNYDYNAPKLINWSSTRWGTATNLWESNCERVLRQVKIWMSNLGGQSGMNLVCLLSPDLYAGFLNHMAAKFRGLLPHQESMDLGFSDALNFEGMSIMFDYEVPPLTFYVFDVRMMELESMDNVLFGQRGPDYRITDGAWLFKVGFWGQARFRPKHFAKGFQYAAA